MKDTMVCSQFFTVPNILKQDRNGWSFRRQQEGETIFILFTYEMEKLVYV